MRQHDIQLLENRLDLLTKQIHALEQEMDKANPKLRETYQAELKELEGKRRTAVENLAKLKRENAESWSEENVQAGIINIFDEIGDRLGKLIDRFRSAR